MMLPGIGGTGFGSHGMGQTPRWSPPTFNANTAGEQDMNQFMFEFIRERIGERTLEEVAVGLDRREKKRACDSRGWRTRFPALGIGLRSGFWGAGLFACKCRRAG